MNINEGLRKGFEKQDLGTHLCCIYRDKEEQLSALSYFMSLGVERNEKCLYIVDDRTKEEVIEAFESMGFDVEKFVESGQFEFMAKSESYLKGGYFDPDEMINLLEEAKEEALEGGYNGLRVTGEMTWFFTDMPGVEKLMEYETKLNEFLPDQKVMALCQYNEEKFTPETLVDVFHTHPKVLIYNDLHENTLYMPPKVFKAQQEGKVTQEHYEGMKEDIIQQARLRREKEEAKDRLEKEKGRAQKYLDIADVIIVAQGRNQEVVEINERGCEVLGYDRDEVIGKNWYENFLPERVRKDVVEDATEPLMNGRVEEGKRYENSIVTKDGEERIISWKNSVIRDDDGEVIGILSSGRDITDRKEAENRIKHLNSLLKSIRNVNQVIVQGEGLHEVMQGACEELVEERMYIESTIALLDDETGEISPTAEAGEHTFTKKWSISRDGTGEAPDCVKRTVESGEIEIIDTEDCVDCDYEGEGEVYTSVTVPMKNKGQIVGVLYIGLDKGNEIDEEEKALLIEAANDLAFAREKAKAEKAQRERVKELNCLYGISKLAEEYGSSLEDILQGSVELIPSSWQYPEITCARLVVDDEEFRTDNYSESEWKMESDILVGGEKRGFLEVVYLEERPELDEGPFLKEERDLIEDITRRLGSVIEKLEFEEELVESEERYRKLSEEFELILDHIPGIVFYKDLENNFIRVNKRLAEAHDMTKEELEGKSLFDLYPEEEAREYWEDDKEVIESGEPKLNVVEPWSPEEKRWVSTSKIPYTEDGEVKGIIGISIDITERKEVKEREEFLNTLLRQDLRSKCQSIQGYLQLLGRADLSEKFGEYLDEALEDAAETGEILELARKINKIERSEGVSDKDIGKVLGKAMDDVSYLVDRERVEIEENYPEKIGNVKGNYSLKTFFTEILKTRIRTTECGEIRIVAEESEKEILVRIDDDGESLPGEVEDLFSGEVYTGRTTGVGGVRYYMIGRIAENNDARIEVGDSEFGGARLEIYLKKA